MLSMFYQGLFILYVNILLVRGASFQRDKMAPQTCETKECNTTAEQIKKWMNPAFKPCEDFYEFSCGYWHSPDHNIENKKHNMSLGSRGNLFTVHLKSFLLDDAIDKESELFHMAKQFMKMCLDEEAIEARGVTPAVDFMRKMGGWPVLEEDWSEDDWDLMKTEALFGGVFFSFQSSQSVGSSHRLIISPNYIYEQYFQKLSEGFENESVQEYYKQKCDLAEEFGANKSKAESEMKVTVMFEIAMSKLEKETYITFLTGNISRVQDTITWVNWTQLLHEILPESFTLPINETVEVENKNYLIELGKLIKNYPKRTIANYMFSRAASTILKKYLPKKTNNSTANILESRFDTCARILKRSSVSGIIAAYLARQSAEDTRVAMDMAKNILDELLIELKELEWLDEETRSVAIKTLQDTTFLIGFPEEITSVNSMEALYKDVKVNTSYFFEAAMDSKIWMQKERFRNLGKPFMEYTLQEKIDAAVYESAFFSIKTNQIVVSPAFLHFLPLFSSKVPAYINYGNLGAVIAHELTHALDFQTDNAEKQMKAIKLQQLFYRWESNETEKIYDEKKQCIIDQYSSFNDSEYTGRTLNGYKTQIEDVADNGGLRLAFNAYRRLALQLTTPEPKLPKLEQYSPEQLFMISVANTYCEIPTQEELMMMLKWSSHSPFQFRVKGMMMNSADFSKAFSCKEGDLMNPKKKCRVW